MEITLSANGVDLSDGLRAHVRHTLKRTLGGIATQVVRVELDLQAGGGVRRSTTCRLRIVVGRNRAATVERTDANLLVAIDEVIENAGLWARRILSAGGTGKHTATDDRASTVASAEVGTI